jgi:hypothetical protein
MNLRQSLVIAALLSLAGLSFWEMYWRSQGFYPSIDDDNALWSIQRAKVDRATKEDVVIVGSSRVMFDIQLYEWEKITGKRPIQLAAGGCSPLPVFHDIVHTSDFNGTILVGVTPGLFFSTTNPKAQPWAWPQSKVDYFHKMTYAQILNHHLSIPLQKSFAFLSQDEGVDGINLGELIKKIKIEGRVYDPMPPFHEFADVTEDRNVSMKEQAETDTAYANSIKAVWKFFSAGGGPPPDKSATLKFFLDDLKVFKARGGKVILVRCPSSDFLREHERKITPRTEFWDQLVQQAQVKAYHFEDYPQLQNLSLPEWSHLSAGDAEVFTRELFQIMIKDKALPYNMK